MYNIAIITARGGSKRIPRKNIKEFCGKPILLYSIEAALQSNLFDEVMVSTDDEEIADIAKAAGASIPFMRSIENANDFATTADVLMEVFEEYEKRGKVFEYAACIYPTAPFVTKEKLREGIRRLKEKNGNILVPVVAFSFPPQRGMVTEDERLVYKWPEYRNSRSQDLEKMYHDCGQFYWYNVKKFIEKRGQFDKDIVPMIIPETEVQDIDSEEDWTIAELKYKQLLYKGEERENKQ